LTHCFCAQVEDKIQSGAEGITLQLDQVPKFLKPLVSGWAAKAFVASFKVSHHSEKASESDLYASWKRKKFSSFQNLDKLCKDTAII